MILSGLEAGQSVVVSGQFLIDSEASLVGAYQRMGQGAGMAQGMSGMTSMDGMAESSMKPAMEDMGDMKGMHLDDMQNMDGMKEKAP